MARKRIDALATDAMVAKGGNIRDAAEYMTLKIQEDEAMIREVVLPAIRRICFERCKWIHSQTRGAIEGTQDMNPRSSLVRGYLAAIMHDNTRLMELPLMGAGVTVREATRGQIQESVRMHYLQAEKMMQMRQFLISVANYLPDNVKKVGDVMTEERLQALMQAAQNKSVM